MAPIVEAKSLAFLTTLASDPPLYPYNPTHTAHEPLVLYIVRVPGSKDVFLTPLKPRDKVVNAQDVQSSLYFLHVDEPDEAAIVPKNGDQNYTFHNDEPPQRTSHEGVYIGRKPLPTPPMSPVEFTEEQLLERNPSLVTNVPKRKPVFPRASRNSVELDLPQIPPRPSHRTSTSFDGSQGGPLLQVPGQSYHAASHLDSQHSIQSDSGRYQRPDMDTLPTHEDPTLSLTLIRRDPTSGAQWNVAKIYDPPIHEVSSESTADSGMYRAKRSGAPLFIDINNPGYSKFLHSQQVRPVSRNSTETSSMDSNIQGGDVFRRRLWMDGSRFADHSYSHRKQPSTDKSRSSLYLDPKDFQVSPRALVDRRSRGYTFRSPWDGRCEFATSVSGRALKCKHYPDHSGSASAEISELRFNLPAAGGTSGGEHGTDHSSKRSSRLLRPSLHKHHSSEFSVFGSETPDDLPNYFDEMGNLDLALGQERAGGGFHGKRAKLGKLIIEDAGLRMLDLTVATNLALWWRAYERA